MKIIVTGKNITISEKIQDAIDKRFEKLGKFFADDIQANMRNAPEHTPGHFMYQFGLNNVQQNATGKGILQQYCLVLA